MTRDKSYTEVCEYVAPEICHIDDVCEFLKKKKTRIHLPCPLAPVGKNTYSSSVDFVCVSGIN